MSLIALLLDRSIQFRDFQRKNYSKYPEISQSTTLLTTGFSLKSQDENSGLFQDLK